MRMLGVFAHPDDETYTMGGSMALYTAQGARVTILTFTCGEAGRITDGVDATPETLGEVREAELRAACALVGCDDVRIVGTADGATVVTDDGVEAIASVIRDVGPDVVITMEPEGVTRHPDHMAVSVMCMRAVEQVVAEGKNLVLYLAAIPQSIYDEWQEVAAAAGMAQPEDDPLAPRPAPDETIACIVDTGAMFQRKVAALRAHRTQAQEFVDQFPAEVVEAALRREAFQRHHPPRRPDERVTGDLFEGMR